MVPAPLSADEPGRLRTLRELRLLDAEPDAAIDTLVRLAAGQVGRPMATLALVDDARSTFHAAHGLRHHDVPRPVAFCAHVVASGAPLDVPDAAGDARFTDNPLVTGAPRVRAYTGAPLRVDGQVVGVLAVMDTAPGALDAARTATLAAFAALAESLLQSRWRERRMRLQAARMRTASLSNSDWLWETDDQGRVTWVSDSIEAHTGRPSNADYGLRMPEINRRSPADVANSWDRFMAARGRLEPFRDLITERSGPNGPFVTSINGMPVFDSRGVFRGYRGATSNITPRLKAEEDAKAAQRLLGSALEALVAAVMISDAEGRTLLANDAWRENVAGTADDDTRRTWPETVRAMVMAGRYPDAVGNEEAFIAWRLGLASDRGEQHEVRWDDRWKMVSDRRLPGGGMLHLSVDITVQKRAELALAAREAELRESREQVAAVLGALPDLWFVLDADDRFIECSDADHPGLLMDWDRLRGRTLASTLPDTLARQAGETVARMRRTGEVQRHEYPMRTRDGLDRRYEARVSPMPGGRVLYVTRDLTDLRALERDLYVMKRAVEAGAALPMCVCDATRPDMPLVYANPAFETLTGYAAREVLGRNMRLLQGHLQAQPALQTLREAIAGRRECSVVLHNVRKDGSVFSNAVHVAPVFDTDGTLTHFIGVLHDVTEQTRAADKLRLSEELYRSVASAISDGLVVVTPTLTVIAINPAGCEVLGVQPSAVVGVAGDWPFQFLSESARPLAPEEHPVRRVVATGEPFARQVHALRRPDGQLRWIELNAHPLQLRPDGSTFSVVMTFRDVTQQRADAQALVAAEERWKLALEGSGDGVWDWNADTHKVFYSPRWKKMLGYAEHEVGDTIEEWTSRIHPDDLPRVMAGLRRHLRGETLVYQSEHRVRHRDGHELWLLDRGKVVARDAGGRPTRVVGTHSDVTSARQAEQALREKQAAELASQAKSQFLSRMSHEMRTPLNAVIGFAQLMRMTPGAEPDTELGEHAQHVLDAGQHLLALINDVLDLQQVEEGGVSLAIGPVPLEETVLRTLELLRPAAAARQVAIDNQIEPVHWVRADARRLRQVVLNIVSNAIKYNHPGGTVRLSARLARRRVLALVIEDTGPGMTDAQMARLFQPFERLGKETSNVEGTGLGLIIARSLTQALGGRLDVSSRAGSGTRVTIELPRERAPDTEHETIPPMPDSDPSPAPARLPLRMLYVEDNRINALLFEGALRMHASQVELRVAEDGDEALAIAREFQPEVLVLDAHLPGLSGFDVLRELRRLPGLATAPAYMCSADAMPEDVQRAYEAGFIGYWTKPIDIAAVLADIDTIGKRLRGDTAAA